MLRENCPVVGAADARSQGPKYVSFTRRKLYFGGRKTRVRNFAGGKSPCGLGRPGPRLAKLRVSLERHSCCAKIAQWTGPRTPEAKDPTYASFTRRELYFGGRTNQGAQFCWWKKALRTGDASPRNCGAKGCTCDARQLPSGSGRGRLCILSDE